MESKFIISSIFSLIFIIAQQSLVPLTFYNSKFYSSFQQISTQIISISLIILSISQLNYFKYERIDMHNEDILKINCLNDKIIPAMNEINQIEQKSIKDLLECSSELHFIKQCMSNPKLFQNDFIDCINYLLIIVLIDIVKPEQLKELKDSIKQENLIYLEKMSRKISISIYKDQIGKLNKQQINSLSLLKLERDNIIQDYNYFIQLLSKSNNYQINLKKNSLNVIINKTLKNMENYHFIKSNAIKVSKNVIIQNKKIDNYFFHDTFIQKIASKIKKDNSQDQIVDKCLGNIQIDNINKNNQILNYEYIRNDFNLSTEKIYKLIEDLIGCETEKTSNNDNNSQIKSKDLKFISRQANDKDSKIIHNKIVRKLDNQNEYNIPQFQFLIKDAKRMSLIFSNSDEILNQIICLKKYFGNEFQHDVKIKNFYYRISEIKNGFKNYDSSQNNNQVDMKIIFEIMNSDQDLAFRLEVQINLDILIKFKVADHAIYNFTRAKQYHNNILNEIDQFKYYESTLRQIQAIFGQLIFIFSILLFLTSMIITLYNYFLSQSQIKCQMGRKDCFYECLQFEKLEEQCQQYFNIQYQDIDQKNNMIFCSKFRQFNQKTDYICNSMHEKLQISTVNSPDDFCLRNNTRIVQCMHNNIQDRNKDLSKIDKLYLNGNSYVQIDEKNIIKQNLLQFELEINAQFKQFLSNAALDFGVDDRRVCVLFQSKDLMCSEYITQILKIKTNSSGSFQSRIQNNGYHDMRISHTTNFNQNIQEQFIEDNQHCAIKIQGQLICQFFNNQTIFEDMIISGQQVSKVSLGNTHFCQLDTYLNLYCNGSNQFGESEINKYSSIIEVGCGQNITCQISDENKIDCLGKRLNFDKNQFYDYKIVSFSISSGYFGFIDNENNLLIVDNDKNQDIPYDDIRIIPDVKFISASRNDYCVIFVNDKLSCNSSASIPIPNQIAYVSQVQSSFTFNCAIDNDKNRNQYACWGLNSLLSIQRTNVDNAQHIHYQYIDSFKANTIEVQYQYKNQLIINYNNKKGNQANNNILIVQEFSDNEIKDLVGQQPFDYQRYCFVFKTKIQCRNLTYFGDSIFLEDKLQNYEEIVRIDSSKQFLCIFYKDHSLIVQGLNTFRIQMEEFDKNVYLFNINQNELCILDFKMNIKCIDYENKITTTGINQFDFLNRDEILK